MPATAAIPHINDNKFDHHIMGKIYDVWHVISIAITGVSIDINLNSMEACCLPLQ